MKKTISAALIAMSVLCTSGGAHAAVRKRSFNVTANQFVNFFGQAMPFQSFSADLTLTYDDSKSGFFGAPDLLRVVTDGELNAGAFSATPIAG